MTNVLPPEVAYPSDSEISVHLAAGRYYGKVTTCGSKIKWATFDKAYAEANRLNEKNPSKSNEAYPCYFCSDLTGKPKYTWHVGRAMTSAEWSAFFDHADEILEMEEVELNASGEDFGENLGKTTLRVHNRKMCEGRNCCIHNPSDHHMVTWEMNWRGDRKMMERICPHGVGHPDPDDAAFQSSIGYYDGVHGCDGCCAVPSPPEVFIG